MEISALGLPHSALLYGTWTHLPMLYVCAKHGCTCRLHFFCWRQHGDHCLIVGRTVPLTSGFWSDTYIHWCVTAKCCNTTIPQATHIAPSLTAGARHLNSTLDLIHVDLLCFFLSAALYLALFLIVFWTRCLNMLEMGDVRSRLKCRAPMVLEDVAWKMYWMW